MKSQSPKAIEMRKMRADMKAKGYIKRVWYIKPEQEEQASKYMLTRLKAIRGS